MKSQLQMRILIVLSTLVLLAACSSSQQTGARDDGPGVVEINVDSANTHQRIEGFGTCLVPWVADMRELYRTEEFQRTYVETLGFNMLRANMWGPVFERPTEDWRDISHEDFDLSVNHGRAQVFVDFARAMKKLNPDVRLIGTVWSPPAWMKMNNSITDERAGAIRADSYTRGDRVFDNRVDPKYFPHFVKWMVEYVKLHKDAGVPFYAVSLGNEVQFSQTFLSCVWTAEDYVTVLVMLGRMLEAEGLGEVKIFGPETMTSHFYRGGTPQYIEAIMENEEARKYLYAVATHGYEDGFKAEMSANSSARLRDFISEWGVPLWMTEGGTGGHHWPEPLHEGVAAATHNALVAGNCSAFVPWQVSGRGGSTHNLMVMNTPTHKTCAMMHFSRFIPTDSVRVDTDPAFGDVKAGAYVHPETRRLTIVLINDTEEDHPVRINLRNTPPVARFDAWRTSADETLQQLDPVPVHNQMLGLVMPAESMVTLSGTFSGVSSPGF